MQEESSVEDSLEEEISIEDNLQLEEISLDHDEPQIETIQAEEKALETDKPVLEEGAFIKEDDSMVILKEEDRGEFIIEEEENGLMVESSSLHLTSNEERKEFAIEEGEENIEESQDKEESAKQKETIENLEATEKTSSTIDLQETGELIIEDGDEKCLTTLSKPESLKKTQQESILEEEKMPQEQKKEIPQGFFEEKNIQINPEDLEAGIIWIFFSSISTTLDESDIEDNLDLNKEPLIEDNTETNNLRLEENSLNQEKPLKKEANKNLGTNNQEVKEVLSYLDTLFGHLPEEKVKEFAKSKYYDLYNKLFDDLGI